MAELKLEVPPPKITDRVFKKPLMCGPGPTDIYPSVYKAMSLPVIAPSLDEYNEIIKDIRIGLKYIFQTKSDLILAISGSGHTGMETIISNLVGPGERLLVASRGIWDERAAIMATRYGVDVKVTKVPPYSTFSMQHLEEKLSQYRPAALFITHGDSSTGTVQDLTRLGDLCHKFGTLLLVDTVVSLGGSPFLMDAWGVDAVYTSTQKVLSGPAGISPVAFSSRAEKVINNRKFDAPFYFDIKLLAPQWNCYGDTRVYHHTMSPPLMWALRECLKEICKETLPALWTRHEKILASFHKKLQKLPVKFYVPIPSDRLVTVTTIVLPDGYNDKEVSKHLENKYNIYILGGLGPTVGTTLRIGIMGINATEEVVDKVISALGKTLIDLRKTNL